MFNKNGSSVAMKEK